MKLRAGVPQTVSGQAGDPKLSAVAAEKPREVLGMVVAAAGLGEDVVRVLPLGGGKALGRLELALLAKDTDEAVVQLDGAHGVPALAGGRNEVVPEPGDEVDDVDGDRRPVRRSWPRVTFMYQPPWPSEYTPCGFAACAESLL